MFESSTRTKQLLTRPRLILTGSLAVGLIVALLPPCALEPLRVLYNLALEPAQIVAGRVVARAETLVSQARHAAATADEVSTLAAEAAQSCACAIGTGNGAAARSSERGKGRRDKPSARHTATGPHRSHPRSGPGSSRRGTPGRDGNRRRRYSSGIRREMRVPSTAA